MSYESFAEELRKWWSFDGRQMHTHSWHGREDFIKGRMRELIDAETKPLHIDIEVKDRALSFIRDLATEEYGYAQVGTGAEVVLRKIIQRANTELGE